MKDYYLILGIPQTAKHAEIRKAYRKRALELHPDTNHSPKAKEEFLSVSEAYQVLKYAVSRARYDRNHNANFLKQETASQNHFDRTKTRTKAYSRRAQDGRNRGENETKKHPKRFKREKSFRRFFDFLGFIVDFASIFV